MTDYEFSGSSDNEQSDAEAEYDDDVSDFEDDEFPLPDLQSACRRERYESTAGTWTADPPPRVETFTPYNPLPEEPKNPDSESDLFGCFISVEIIKIIVKHTNEEFDLLRKKFEREGSGKPPPLDPTNENEIKALLGLWLNLGISGFQGVSVDSIFATGSGSLPAHLTFSRNRYKILMRAIRFDSKLERKKGDKLAPIREVFEKFTANCTENYRPGEFVTVDETLVGFRGRCSFRMFIPSKAEKFGIKVWTCVDSHTKYLHNAMVYLGKQGESERNLGMEVVNRLTRDLVDAGRTVVCDNFFTSPELGQNLWQKKTYLLGTVRSNRQGLPKDFVNEELAEKKARYVYNKHQTLMKLQVRKTKSVLLYSTFHHRPAFNKRAQKPQIVADYNKTKCGVDQFDEMTKHFSFSPATRRWPVKIMQWLVNVAAMNAWVLYQKQNKSVKENTGTRRNFLSELSKQLMEPQQNLRSRSDNYLTAGYNEIAKMEADLAKKAQGDLASTRFRCPICKERSRDGKDCQKCGRHVCLNDANQVVYCKDCKTTSPARKVSAPLRHNI